MPVPFKAATVIAASLAVAACSTDRPPPQRAIGMPNPASAYCIKLGGTLEMVAHEQGMIGICTLPSGEKIEEWHLFRRDHAKPQGA